MSAREELFRRVAGAFVSEDRANKLIDDVVAEALPELAALRARVAELEAQLPYREVWSNELPPGGFVCNVCGQPVESEPCPDHAPKPQQQTEDPHASPLHHNYALGRDLPAIPHQTTGRCPKGHTFEDCTCGGAA